MKKIFRFLCVVILFIGIVGCPSSDDQTTLTKSAIVSNPSSDTNNTVPVGGDGNTFPSEANGGNPSPVPEPFSIILLGTGLIGLAGYGRKRFKK